MVSVGITLIKLFLRREVSHRHKNEHGCVPIKPYLEKWVAGQILTYKFWCAYFSSKQFCEVDNNDIIIHLKDKEA